MCVFVMLENRTREASPIYQSLGYVTVNKSAAAAAVVVAAIFAAAGCAALMKKDLLRVRALSNVCSCFCPNSSLCISFP